ncbi:MAG TPA: SUMF1/EgtB/PvdO family nonheme iron enzyme [Thermoanaerobaculia bacterium]|nr:SUMF1/EgtB/PvdO family nonheme iron enzyme [Thermoanaerobaculia bacterium]
MPRDLYTRYPRPLLWLVPGGDLWIEGQPGIAAQRVEIAPFYLSKLPVDNEQFEAFDPGFQRGAASAGDRDPAVGVSWEEAQAYCAWYAEIARKPIRLPDELEWEHACRAGNRARAFWGDDPEGAEEHAWDARNSGGRVPRLEAKRANEHGLYGVLGGVWEWTASPWRELPAAEVGRGDATLPPDAPRVLRGGSFRVDRAVLGCALRKAAAPGERFDDAGFRIARSLRQGRPGVPPWALG